MPCLASAPSVFVCCNRHVLALHCSTEVSAPVHPADRREDRQGVNTLAEALQQPHSAISTAQAQVPPDRCQLPGFSPAEHHSCLQGTFCSTSHRGTAPWSVIMGFRTPCCHSSSYMAWPACDHWTPNRLGLGTSRPLTLRSGGELCRGSSNNNIWVAPMNSFYRVSPSRISCMFSHAFVSSC
jgi:hypothetical protein